MRPYPRLRERAQEWEVERERKEAEPSVIHIMLQRARELFKTLFVLLFLKVSFGDGGEGGRFDSVADYVIFN